MRITLILFILPCFFNVLLASPVPGNGISRHIVGGGVSGPKFEGCTPKQEGEITEAVHHAVAYVKDSLEYLKTYREDAPRFKEWFGAPNREAWESLRTLFKNIEKHIPHDGVYVCELCKEDEYTYAVAYVKHEDLGRVHICPRFSETPLVGHQSKASFIIHEWSHFNAVGGTLDHESTVYGCRHWLPVHQRAWALKNAYSIQYFAENVPHLD